MLTFERGTIVITTHNRRSRLLQTLRGLLQLPDGWPVIVVDNGSSDGSIDAVRQEFPTVLVIKSRRNIGTAARNIAVAFVHTPYVAFCDEDTQWQPGSLERAADVLDAHPTVGVLNGCVVAGETGRIEADCLEMARSPLDRENLPGPQLLSFMADASVVRTRAFYEAGGFWPPLFMGGEEALLSLDLAERGWRIIYMEDVVLKRFHTAKPQAVASRLRAIRNAIWVAWMRLPADLAWRETLLQLRNAPRRDRLRVSIMLLLSGVIRVLRERHVTPPRVAAMRELLMDHARSDPPAGSTRPSRQSMA